MRESIKLAREIFAQKAFDEFRDGETEPGENAVTDDQLDAFAREKADSAYHPSCTCKMGDPNTDSMAVVDSSTKVIGKPIFSIVPVSWLRITPLSKICSPFTWGYNLPIFTYPYGYLAPPIFKLHKYFQVSTTLE